VTPTLFFTLAGSLTDPEARSLLWEQGAAAAFESPQMAGLIDRSLPVWIPPKLEDEENSRTFVIGDNSYPEPRCRERVLEVVLKRYGEKRDPALLEVLSRHLEEWARWKVDSDAYHGPALRVGDFVEEEKWTEFGPQLRALQGSVSSPDSRRKSNRR